MEKFLPQRAAIEHFGAGGFRFGGMSHQGSLLILPSGMRAWSPMAIGDVTVKDCAAILIEAQEIDFLLIGTGGTMARLPRSVADHLVTSGLQHDAMSTSAAIHTYNIMLAEDRRVAAALIAVDSAMGRGHG